MSHPATVLPPNAIMNFERPLCHDDYTMIGDFCSLWSPQSYSQDPISSLSDSAEFLGLFHDVYAELGLPTSSDMDKGAPNALGDRAYFACHGANDANFKMHLVAAEYFLDQINLGRKRNLNSHSSATGEQCIANSHGAVDPFLRFINEGASEEVARLVLENCPSERPPLDLRPSGRASWQWAATNWLTPTGWDCVFMMNLLLGPDPEAASWETIYSSAPDFGSFSTIYSAAFVPVLMVGQ